MSKNNSESLTLSVPQAAALLGVSVRTAYNLVRQKGFPAFRISENRIVVSRAGLEQWVAEQSSGKGMAM